MRSPGQAILWQIVWRSRFGLLAAGSYLVAAILLTRVLPHDLTLSVGDQTVPAVGWFLGMPAVLINILLVAVFSMSGADLQDSAFASHMFTLPVRTRTLVAWPMVVGCFALMAVWWITAALVFRPGGILAPLWWPAGALAYFLASFQAISWTPFAQRWLHVALTSVVMVFPIAILPVLLLLDIELSEPAAALLFLAVLPAAYLAALTGVARARRGDPYHWQIFQRRTDRVSRRRARVRRPFSSWWTAQLWFECRAHVWTVPVFFASMLMCILFLPALDRHNIELGWRFLGILLTTPIFLALMCGASLGTLYDPLSKSSAASFILARPISSVQIVKSKLLAAAVTTVALWIITLGFTSLLLTRPGFPESILAAAEPYPAWQAIGGSLLVLILLMGLTWKTISESLWIPLTGRPWVTNVTNVGPPLIVLGGGCVGFWLYLHPEWHDTAQAAAPWLLATLLLVKIALAVWVIRSLDRLRLVDRAEIAIMVGIWMLVVVGLCSLTLLLIPPGSAPLYGVISPIAIMTPFCRIAGAPLALEWNRHR